MVEREHGLTFGFPRMDKEAGERRDFLPPLIHRLADLGCEVYVESGIGSGMGYLDEEYVSSPRVRVVDEDAAYRQDVVVVLRAPIGKFEKIRRGATLISMLHFPTRPARVRHLEELAIDAVGLDTIEDDEGRRLVVNSRAVAWNGLEAAFAMLERRWPQLTSPTRGPVRVTVMGAGEIGKHAVEAATKYANAGALGSADAVRGAGRRGGDDRTQPDRAMTTTSCGDSRPRTFSSTRRSDTTPPSR